VASFDWLRCVQGDSCEVDIKNVKHEKHKVQNKLKALRSELEAVSAPSEFDSRLFETACASRFVTPTVPQPRHWYQKTLRFLILDERAQVQQLVDGAKTDLEAHVKSGAKDDKKHRELDKLLHDHDGKRKKIEGLIAELEPELRKWETSLADAKKQVEQLDDARYSLILLAISAELCAGDFWCLLFFAVQSGSHGFAVPVDVPSQGEQNY
jgi:chromosome segregation ATPase